MPDQSEKRSKSIIYIWKKGGVPQLPVMGEFHYNRLDHRYWKDALLKMKSTGSKYCIHIRFMGIT